MLYKSTRGISKKTPSPYAILNGIAEVLTLGLSILTVLLAIGIIFLSVAWVYFIVWLLT